MQVFLVQIDIMTPSGAGTLYLSDIGFIDQSTFSGSSPVCYLPMLDQPLQIDRELPISPESGTSVGATWGDIVILNTHDANGVGHWDNYIATCSCAGRGVRVYVINKTFDSVRGIWIDPATLSSADMVFSGIALDWVMTADQVNVRIRDNLMPLELPIQTNFYGGTGGADGNAQIAGQPIPKLRGTCSNITPVLVDPANLVYQISDTLYQNETIYENGYAGFVRDGNYATYTALIGASIAAGHYATCFAKGLFRMGVTPGTLTVDADGAFPAAGYDSETAVALVQDILTYDCGLTLVTSFTAVDTANPYLSGVYTGTSPMTPIELIDQLLLGLGAALGPNVAGNIAIFQIVPPSGSAAVSFTTAQIIDCQIYDLPDSVIVPNWRRTLGYARNYTVQNTALSPSATAARIQFLANEYAKAVWSNSANKTTWPTAQDAAMTPSQIRSKADAQTAVNRMGALWGVQRYLYDLTLPMALGLEVDLGMLVSVTYPDGPLASGALCVVVGHAIDAKANTVVVRVFL